MTVPAGTVSSKTGSACCSTRPSCCKAGGGLVERQADEVGQRSGRRASADDELKRLVLAPARVASSGCVRMTIPAATSSLASRVTTVSQSNPEIWLSASASVEPGEVRHLVGVRLIACDEVGDAAGRSRLARAAIGSDPVGASRDCGRRLTECRPRSGLDRRWRHLLGGRDVLRRHHRSRCARRRSGGRRRRQRRPGDRTGRHRRTGPRLGRLIGAGRGSFSAACTRARPNSAAE